MSSIDIPALTTTLANTIITVKAFDVTKEAVKQLGSSGKSSKKKKMF